MTTPADTAAMPGSNATAAPPPEVLPETPPETTNAPVADPAAANLFAHDAILDQVATWRDAGRRVALATVIQTWGSSPRPVGSQLAVDEAGAMVGSVSGGCIEGAVVQEAMEIMAGAPPKLLEFGVSNEQAWEVGLACGGTVRVFVEAVE